MRTYGKAKAKYAKRQGRHVTFYRSTQLKHQLIV